MSELEEIKEEVIKKFGYDENLNLSPLAENIGFAFNKSIEDAVEYTYHKIAKQFLKDIKTARGCLLFKGCSCNNKDCKNTACPLHYSYETEKEVR